MKPYTLLKPLLTVFCFLIVLCSGAQVIRHTYRFNSDLQTSAPDCGSALLQAQALGNCPASSEPGSFISDILPQCGVSKTVYHTNMHWGLEYPNTEGAITETYTIHLYVKTTDFGSKTWARIIDFSDGQSDGGIYYKASGGSDRCLDFYPNGVVGACPNFNNRTYYLLTFTRNAITNIIDVYVDSKLFVSYNDAGRKYVGTRGIPIYIYRDDKSVSCESGEGNFAYLSFSNQYSVAAEVTAVYNSICTIANSTSADFDMTPSLCGTSDNAIVNYTGNIPESNIDYNFVWDWDGGNIISGSGRGPYNINWSTGGTKTVRLSVKGGSCSSGAENSKTITIGNLQVSAISAEIGCTDGSEGTINVAANGGTSPYQYSMDDSKYVDVSSFKATPGTYQLYAKDARGCKGNATASVVLKNDLTLDVSGDATVCKGKEVVFRTNSNATLFSWRPATGLNKSDIASPIAKPTTTTTYKVTATYGSCTAGDEVTVTVAPGFHVIATPSFAEVEPNKPVQLSAHSPELDGENGVQYKWSPAVGLNRTDIANPVAVISSPQNYVVTLTSPQGCEDTAHVTLKVIRQTATDISVPDGFTPNGDNLNDLLRPVGNGIAQLHYFIVFNRFGQQIFFTKTWNEGWNGKLQGNDQPAGTYVWLVEGITAGGKVITKKGTSLLIR